MSDAIIPTTPGAGGPSLDAELVTRVDGTLAYRERVQITGVLPANIANVDVNKPGPETYAVSMRAASPIMIAPGNMDAIMGALSEIADILRHILERL